MSTFSTDSPEIAVFGLDHFPLIAFFPVIPSSSFAEKVIAFAI
jgi:hypothetical protein